MENNSGNQESIANPLANSMNPILVAINQSRNQMLNVVVVIGEGIKSIINNMFIKPTY